MLVGKKKHQEVIFLFFMIVWSYPDISKKPLDFTCSLGVYQAPTRYIGSNCYFGQYINTLYKMRNDSKKKNTCSPLLRNKHNLKLWKFEIGGTEKELSTIMHMQYDWHFIKLIYFIHEKIYEVHKGEEFSFRQLTQL